MGFIENLRRQKELEEQQELVSQRLREEKTGEKTRLAAIRQKVTDSAEREKQEQLKKDIVKAQEYFDKSDFSRLAEELKSVAQENITVVGGVVVPNIVVWSIRDFDLDQDNAFSRVGISLIWYAGQRNRHKKKENWSDTVSYDVWEDIYNFITIGCDQTGEITLRKSWGDIKLPLSRWFGNSNVQEEALGKAYGNPKKYVEKDRNNKEPSMMTEISSQPH